jgi:adenine-specific DNA methylase
MSDQGQFPSIHAAHMAALEQSRVAASRQQELRKAVKERTVRDFIKRETKRVRDELSRKSGDARPEDDEALGGSPVGP